MKQLLILSALLFCNAVFSQSGLESKCSNTHQHKEVGVVVGIINPNIISPITAEGVFEYQIIVQSVDTGNHYTKVIRNTEKVYQIMQFLHIDKTFILIKSVDFIVNTAEMAPHLIKEN